MCAEERTACRECMGGGLNMGQKERQRERERGERAVRLAAPTTTKGGLHHAASSPNPDLCLSLSLSLSRALLSLYPQSSFKP